MTKVKITTAEDGILLNWATGRVELTAEEPRLATFVDIQSEYVLEVRGDGLRCDGDTLVDGRVERLSFFNEEGQLALKVTGEYIARELGAYLREGNPTVFESFLFSGDDTFVGSKQGDYIAAGAGNDTVSGLGGDDEIYGGGGQDVLGGGKGSDVFFFERGYGMDVITDFDAQGGGHRQDYITSNGVAFDDIELRKAGDDVLMDFGNGDVLRILDARLKDITEADFLTPVELL